MVNVPLYMLTQKQIEHAGGPAKSSLQKSRDAFRVVLSRKRPGENDIDVHCATSVRRTDALQSSPHISSRLSSLTKGPAKSTAGAAAKVCVFF